MHLAKRSAPQGQNVSPLARVPQMSQSATHPKHLSPHVTPPRINDSPLSQVQRCLTPQEIRMPSFETGIFGEK